MKTNIHFIISRLMILIMRHAADKICKENQNMYFIFNFSENRAVSEMM
jgi:hypothetical protein